MQDYHKQNLPSKSDIVNFVKKTDFDHKLKSLNKNVTSNKTKLVLVENELNKLSQKRKAISRKTLLNSVLLMEQNVFLQEYIKTI